MIPTLHKYRLFGDSNGEAVLSDLTSCIVTEVRNGEYKLEAAMPKDGAGSDIINRGDIIMAQPNPYAARTQPFRIVKLNRSTNGGYKITAEHISRKLNGVYCAPFAIIYKFNAQEFLAAVSANAIRNIDPIFTFSSNITQKQDYYYPLCYRIGKQPSSVMSLLTGKEYSLIDYFPDGTLVFDRNTVAFRDDFGKNRGAVIRYGINMLQLNQELTIRDFATNGYPFYMKNGEFVDLPEKVIDYGFSYDVEKTELIDLTREFPDAVPTETQLRDKASAWIAGNAQPDPPNSIKFGKADIPGDVEIQMNDTVRVVFPMWNFDAEYPVVGYKFDALEEKYTELTVGGMKRDLADTILTLTRR